MAEITLDPKKIRLLSSSELAAFCLQTSIILKSGIPLHDGLSMLYDDMEDTGIKNMLKVVSKEVSAKKPLQDGLIKAGVFPDYMINMVQIGSLSGKLDDVMSSLAAFYEREDDMRQSIKSAVVYPMVLILMMFIVMMVLAVKVLPVFSQVFISLGTTMSPGAAAIMNLGLSAGKYSMILLIIGALLCGAALFLFRTERGRTALSAITSRGKFSEKIAVSRFASSMSMMLSSGLDTERALRMSEALVSNNKIKSKINRCIQLIDENSSFIDALYATSLFPKMTTRMLSLGFRAGSLDSIMHKIAGDYEEEIEATLLKRVSLIEPVSVALLSIMIGVILISVMLPLMGVMSSIG